MTTLEKEGMIGKKGERMRHEGNGRGG